MTVEFDTDWRTLGKHRIKLRSTKGFPTELMQQIAELTRLAVDNNMSARARIVEIVFR
jgi:alanyl-tRNA synthetase